MSFSHYTVIDIDFLLEYPKAKMLSVACLTFMLILTLSIFPYVAISGEYGQLGHQSLMSTDEPQCVEFFREQHMRVIDVVCGPWNTFAAVIKEEA